jgi:hypothetical protein
MKRVTCKNVSSVAQNVKIVTEGQTLLALNATLHINLLRLNKNVLLLRDVHKDTTKIKTWNASPVMSTV